MNIPDFINDSLVNTYKFLRLPDRWAGETFTKAGVLLYIIMKDTSEQIKFYSAEYTIFLTKKFLKFAEENLKSTGGKLNIINGHALADNIISWDGENKKVDILLKKTFNNGEEYVEYLYEMLKNTQDLGWSVL
jgi:hypothetical protein